MHRYLALLWDPCNLEAVRTFQSWKAAFAGQLVEWAIACEVPGTLVIHTGQRRGSMEAHPLANNAGVVLGRVFARGDTAARIAFDSAETQRIVASGGQHLVDRYWGAYVAIVHDPSQSKHHVFRDPIGNVPCYRTRFGGVDCFFSHIEDCLRLLPIAFSINRRYLTRALIHCLVTTRDTGLENVENVLAGERVTLSQGRRSNALLWDPIAIARTPHFEQPDEAARALRSTVQNTIDAWASCYQNIALKLSGGFDSSVVAGCLAQTPTKPRISYLNSWIDMELDRDRLHLPGVDQRTADKLRAIAGHGDQRYFARLVAERWKTPLHERQKTLAMDLSRLWNVPFRVAPALYYTVMQTDDAELELAKTHGVQAFFSGQAGDSVFLATTQPFPAMDYAWQHGIGAALSKHLGAAARLSGDSVWAVLGAAVRHGLRRRPYAAPFNVLTQPTLLSAELAQTLSLGDFESDLARRLAHSALPPGKRNHVRGVGWSAYYDLVFNGGRYTDHIHPLNSQPIWELMLQIPTWTLLNGGISRGLARQAFADLLPEEIRKRQMKGSAGPYYQHLVRKNRDFLRSALLDGLLVRQHYLDRRRVEQCLSAEEPAMTVSAVTLLNYLAAEIWLQQWTGSRQRGSGQARAQDATS
jgi:asparagine synthase (glutamine-hydrolysing)